MSSFLQITAGALVTAILGLVLSKQGKDITLLLSLLACCMVLSAAVGFLEPVIDLLEQLQQLGELDKGMMSVMLKAVGIGMISEIANLICTDAGNAALGKTVQMLASAVILWLSVPLLNGLLDLIRQIVGAV